MTRNLLNPGCGDCDGCDICAGDPTQEPCECDGGSPVPSATITISGSLGTEQLLERTGFEVCDPYPGVGTTVGDDTFYDPIEACNSINGSYVVPCPGGIPTFDLIIFSYGCDLSATGANYYYYLNMRLRNTENFASVQIWSGATQTSQILTTGELMTFQAYLAGLDSEIATPTLLEKYMRFFSRVPPSIWCDSLEIHSCSLSGGVEFVNSTGPSIENYSACTLDGLTLEITR